MEPLPYQWGPHKGLKHAWVWQASGLMTTCGQEQDVNPLPPLQGNELSCAACQQAIEWYAKTGEPDYLKPRHPHERTPYATPATESAGAGEAGTGEAEEAPEVR